jgi:uncharacterized protein with FMN-binding domain
MNRFFSFLAAVLLIGIGFAVHAGDTVEIELLNGSKFKGTLIKETPETVTFSSDGIPEMKLETSKIYTVTLKGSTRVLHEKAVAAASGPAKQVSAPVPAKQPPSLALTPGNTRTKDEVEALVKKEGETKPSWFDAITPNYPTTLDLTFTDKSKNQNVNIENFFWNVINVNPARWKEGAKILYKAITVNSGKTDTKPLEDAYSALGDLYHDLLADYPRAAYFWEKANIREKNLADCYYKLGNKDMAKAVLEEFQADRSRHCGLIRLWGEIGEVDTAVKLANERAARNDRPALAFLAAGDVCRHASRWDEAIKFYNDAIAKTDPDQRIKALAKDAIEAINVREKLDLSKIPDGKYMDSCTGYHGQVEMTITVAGGKITDAKVSKHTEMQYYASLTVVPAQIIEKQGVKGVDTFSSATISSEAIINATAKALAKGMSGK